MRGARLANGLAAATAILLLLLPTSSTALYIGVVPIPSELTAICGPYALETPSFTCQSVFNGTQYYDCFDEPANCRCQPQAPPQFQEDFMPPCTFNYGIEPCTGLSQAQLYCGPRATGCTVRCDYLGNCYALDQCACEDDFSEFTGASFCGYPFQGDLCITDTVYGGERDITDCGVFAASAVYYCPSNTTFDSANCKTACTCKPGTGRTPVPADVPSKACDGVDRFCNIADVLDACGDGYVNCTKRCQFNNNAALNLPGFCVVIPGSCTAGAPSTPPPAACDATTSLTLCGPATASCTQTFDSSGTVTNTQCVCADFGFPQDGLPCQRWTTRVSLAAPLCNATCGPGYVASSGCQALRVWTPSDIMLPCPGPCITGTVCNSCPTLTRAQRQAQWMILNRVLYWDPVLVNTVTSASNFRTIMATGVHLTQTIDMIECVCDTQVWSLGWQAIKAATPVVMQQDFQSLMTGAGNGIFDPYGIKFGTGTRLDPQPLNPITLNFDQIGPTATIYPYNINATFGNFYAAFSCRGPSIYWNLNIAYNALPTAPQIPFAIVSSVSPTMWQLCVNRPGALCYNCQQLVPSVTPLTTAALLGAPLATYNQYPLSLWMVTYLNLNDESVASFTCPACYSCGYDNLDSQWGLSRQGQILFIAPEAPYLLSAFYTDTYGIGSMDGSGTCGGRPRGSLMATSSPDLQTLLKADGISYYINMTLLTPYVAYTVYPYSATQGLPGYDVASYGPINLIQYTQSACACNTGWTGSDCHVNSQCWPCVFNAQTCPFSPACSSSITAPFSGTACSTTPGPLCPSTVVFRYDVQVIVPSAQVLNPNNCPYIDPSTSSYLSPACSLTAYTAAAVRMCGHGTVVYGATGVSCTCVVGYTNSILADPISCYAAGTDRFGVSNCAGTVGDAFGCAVANTTNAATANGYGDLTPQCYCGGHGEIDATGSCVCDFGWLKDANGCCRVPNICPAPLSATCGNFSAAFMHTFECNIPPAGGGPANWICTPATSDGYWTGPCCTIFVAYVPCVHGAYRPGETVYNYTNGVLVPMSYVCPRDGPTPCQLTGVNPDGMICVCSENSGWTGASCNTTSCPIGPNGLPCSGISPCVNGQCMIDNACSNPNFYGCACQYSLTDSCKGGNFNNPVCSSNAVIHRGQCSTSTTPDLNLQCDCLSPFYGSYCQNSQCGPTNCNEAEGGGICTTDPNNSTNFVCDCAPDDPNVCSTYPLGCLYGGPTCDSDITQACGVVNPGGTASVCADEGSCNITVPGVPAQGHCQCINGWTGAFCTIQPCSPVCGANGFCHANPSSPASCTCNPHWFPPEQSDSGPLPCTVQDCGAVSHPSGTDCVCNDPTLLYAAPWIVPGNPLYPYVPCSQKACNSSFGVMCGAVSCAVPQVGNACKDPSGVCIFGCSVVGSLNQCNNGVCSCFWSEQLNPTTGACTSRCNEPPFTTTITSTLDDLGQPVFTGCVCATGYSSSDNCFLPICMHGTYNVPPPHSTAPGTCSCQPGWMGARCDMDFCNNRGVYANETSNICTCFFPYNGTNCQQYSCQNGGVPAVNPQTAPQGVCKCPAAFYGMQCEFTHCVHGHATPDGSACQCDLGWQGQYCTGQNCFPPNHFDANGTCICDPSYYGPACMYQKCGTGTFNTTTQSCMCTGVATLRNSTNIPGFLNCTGDRCGDFGLPSTNLDRCFCDNPNANGDPGAQFIPNSAFNAQFSYNCIPTCLNGGTYVNNGPFCSCPPGTVGNYCRFPTPSSSSAGVSSTGRSSSSSGTHHSSTGPSSSTGSHTSDAVRPSALLSTALLPGCCMALWWYLELSWRLPSPRTTTAS